MEPDFALGEAELTGTPSGMPPQLIICSKSRWNPAIRREHALALEAARDGSEVIFLERPLDVRSLFRPKERLKWLHAIVDRGAERHPAAGVRVRCVPTIVPGHRSVLGLLLEARLLERSLRQIQGLEQATVIATLPWHWPAVARVPARRRVLDYTDDWEALVPGREGMIRRLLRRAEAEADAITVVSNDLQEVFEHRSVTVVRNGAGNDVLGQPATPLPGASRIVYLGTLSDRFDASLVGELMARLPVAWTIDLYGPCQYPRGGDQPSQELKTLLQNPRVSWHGQIERDRVVGVLDQADVLVVPHRRNKPGTDRAHPSWRGDVMKLYDYAARGRPIVSTNYADRLAEIGPPELQLVDEAHGFAAAVERAASTPVDALRAQRSWAIGHAWGERWQAWKTAAGFSEQHAGIHDTDRGR